jgi:2,4-dienoyl-CoA reductase-like NADH-dependent reductase (Old Yellow Enzyme family)
VSTRRFPQVKRLAGPAELRGRLDELGVELPVDDEVDPAGPLSQPLQVGDRELANRFSILPMEGWDATADGRPTDLVRRRWRRFGQSGAALIWGGEAVAVRPDGRANPNQLCIGPTSVEDLDALRTELIDAHRNARGTTDGLMVGLQLTHSGRWARPHGDHDPRVAFRHPVLDRRVGIPEGAAGDVTVLSDDELATLSDDYVVAAEVARSAGFDFVDIKACHGYLLHEVLAGWERPGAYGGEALADRARLLLEIVDGVRSTCPDLGVGVRLSAFDVAPYRSGPDGSGVPDWASSDGASAEPRRFGGREPWSTGPAVDPIDLDEPHELVELLAAAGVSMLCVSAGSPYLNPHVQRPAYFPPSDGYEPPEDPLVGVARLLGVARSITVAHPDVAVVGSGFTYLQHLLPNVAQAAVRDGWCDSVGLGRMVLSYPDLPADVLDGRELQPRAICRTFSDCTTAPRHGMVSGCYPLDDGYKSRPERGELALIKKANRS